MAAAGQRDRHLRSEACLARGVERYIAGDLRGAAELFREGLRAQPADVQLTAYLAWVEARLQSDDPAAGPGRHLGDDDDAPAEELLAGAEVGEGRGLPLPARASQGPAQGSAPAPPFSGAEAPVRRFLAQAPTRPNLVPLDVPELTDEKVVELAGTTASSRAPSRPASAPLPRPLLTATITSSIRPDPGPAVAFPPTVEFVPSFDLSLPTNTIQGLGTMAQPPPSNARETVAVIYTRTDANDEGVEVGATFAQPTGRPPRGVTEPQGPAVLPAEARGAASEGALLDEDDDDVPLLIDDELLVPDALERAKRTFTAFAPQETQVEVGPPPGLARAPSSTLPPPASAAQPWLAPPTRSPPSPQAPPSRGPASVVATRRALSPFAERILAMGRAADSGDFGGALQIAEDLLTFARNAGQALPAEHQEAITAVHERALGDRCRFVRMGKLPPHLEPRTAFLLSRVDGSFTVDDLLDISGMDRAAASRLVALLLRSGALVAE